MRMIVASVFIGAIVIFALLAQKGQIEQQQENVRQSKKQAQRIYHDQMVRNCDMTLSAQFCTDPKDDYDRYTCSDRLSSFGCAAAYDVSDLILEEHKNRKPPQQWWTDSSPKEKAKSQP